MTDQATTGAAAAQAGSAAPALHLDTLTVRFGGVTAVRDVSFTVPEGSRWAVIGPNGAGKTTLFRAISGEVSPTTGRVELFGADVTRLPPDRRARRGLGRTFQVTNLFAGLTVTENVAVAAQAVRPGRLRAWWPLRLGGELGEQVDRALEQVGLTGRRHALVSELSHGEQRQLELAVALAGRPRLLLLDEPAAGLAASERVLMRGLVDALPRELTVILIEHDMSLALDLVDQVLCLDNGSPIAVGTPEQIRADEQVQAVYLRSG